MSENTDYSHHRGNPPEAPEVFLYYLDSSKQNKTTTATLHDGLYSGPHPVSTDGRVLISWQEAHGQQPSVRATRASRNATFKPRATAEWSQFLSRSRKNVSQDDSGMPGDGNDNPQADRNTSSWPAGLPAEIYIRLGMYLSHEDLRNCRLTSRELDWGFSNPYFHTVSVRFNANVYELSKNSAMDPNDDRTLGVFTVFGAHIREIGMAFETDEIAIRFAPEKNLHRKTSTYWGAYDWPSSDYTHFNERAALERTALQTARLKSAFAQMKSVNHLGISVDSGTGWLVGPDLSIRGIVLQHPTPIFGRTTTYDEQITAQQTLWEKIKRLYVNKSDELLYSTIYQCAGVFAEWQTDPDKYQTKGTQPLLRPFDPYGLSPFLIETCPFLSYLDGRLVAGAIEHSRHPSGVRLITNDDTDSGPGNSQPTAPGYHRPSAAGNPQHPAQGRPQPPDLSQYHPQPPAHHQLQGQANYPLPIQGYYPPPTQSYYPSTRSYHQPPAQGYHPPPSQGYHPYPAQGYHPPPVYGYRPAPVQGYHPVPTHGYYPPPTHGRYAPLAHGYYLPSATAQHHQPSVLGYHQIPALGPHTPSGFAHLGSTDTQSADRTTSSQAISSADASNLVNQSSSEERSSSNVESPPSRKHSSKNSPTGAGMFYVQPLPEENAMRASFFFSPANLSDLQKQWLLETDWAAQAFISSYILALLDNPLRMENVRQFTISRLSSHLIDSLCRDDLWNALPNLRELTILVIPDWRAMSQDSDGSVADNKLGKPSLAVNNFYRLLKDHVSPKRSIHRLKLGWVGGGEHAEGFFARNNHILPIPVLPRQSMFEFETRGWLAPFILFPYVKELHIVNTWASPCTVEAFIKALTVVSGATESLVLESFSLCARNRGEVPANRRAEVRDLHIPRRDLHEADPVENAVQEAKTAQALAQAYNPKVAASLPGNPDDTRQRGLQALLDNKREFTAGFAPFYTGTATGDADTIRRWTWPEVLHRISPAPLPVRPATATLLSSPEVVKVPLHAQGSSLKRLELVSCGYVKLAGSLEDDLLPPPTPGPATRRLEQVGARKSGLRALMLAAANDAYLGTIVQAIPPPEMALLRDGWRCAEGWWGTVWEPEREAAEFDGCLPGGTGRFGGVVEVAVEKEDEEEWEDEERPEEDEEV